MGYSLSTYYAQLEYIMFLHQLEYSQYAYSTAVLVIIYELVILRTLQFLLVGSYYMHGCMYYELVQLLQCTVLGVCILQSSNSQLVCVLASMDTHHVCIYVRARSMHNSQLFSMHTSQQLESLRTRQYAARVLFGVHYERTYCTHQSDVIQHSLE